MKLVVSILGAFVIALSAAAAGFWSYQWLNPGLEAVPPTGATAEVVGTRRPDFTFSDLDNQPRDLAEWDGKLLIVNFWATWCPPCREEIPIFMKLQDEYAVQGLQFLGITLQGPDEIRTYVTEMGINYPILSGSQETVRFAESLGNTLGVLPYTVVVGRSGTVEFIKAGPLDEIILRRLISEYL